jgi:hypothetical protein
VRKTIKVKELIEQVNLINKNSTMSPKERGSINLFLESILLDCDVYVGFGYYTRQDVPAGEQPGIVWTNENKTVWSDSHDPEATPNPVFPDDSRRRYYISRKL